VYARTWNMLGRLNYILCVCSHLEHAWDSCPFFVCARRCEIPADKAASGLEVEVPTPK
jgi:hypothetical protein